VEKAALEELEEQNRQLRGEKEDAIAREKEERRQKEEERRQKEEERRQKEEERRQKEAANARIATMIRKRLDRGMGIGEIADDLDLSVAEVEFFVKNS